MPWYLDSRGCKRRDALLDKNAIFPTAQHKSNDIISERKGTAKFMRHIPCSVKQGKQVKAIVNYGMLISSLIQCDICINFYL